MQGMLPTTKQVRLTGRRVMSLTLEREFWGALERIAFVRSVGLDRLIQDIHAQRKRIAPHLSLASAARVYALHNRVRLN